MKKSRNSIKGEYIYGTGISGSSVRDFQQLLELRESQMSAQKGFFDGIEHRMENVKTFRGVNFINDAACESENGIYMALSNVSKPVTWITSFTGWDHIDDKLLQMIIRKVKAIVFYGEEDEKTRNFIDVLNIRSDNSEDMEQAVRMAFYASNEDDVVLYSPGTPREEGANTVTKRGNQFKMSVAQL